MEDESTPELVSGSEVVGKLLGVSDGTLRLSCERQYVVRVNPDELARWKQKLRIGAEVGILRLEDGRICVRLLRRSCKSTVTVKGDRHRGR